MDIDDSVCSNLLKFADDTKIFNVVQTKNDIDLLRKDSANRSKWLQDWLKLFNVNKFSVMNNNKINYEMNGNYSEEVTEKKDLGVA